MDIMVIKGKTQHLAQSGDRGRAMKRQGSYHFSFDVLNLGLGSSPGLEKREDDGEGG